MSCTKIVADKIPWETWDDPDLAARSPVRWRLIFSGRRTPTRAMSMGISELPPGGIVPLHHHAPGEIYHVLDGEGVAVIDGVRYELRPGVSLFIAPNAPHRTTNTGMVPLRVLFIFPTDSFEDVAYHFDER